MEVPPGRAGHTWNTVLRFDLGFVNGDLGKVTGVLVPFKRMRNNTGYVNFATKIARKVALIHMVRSLEHPVLRLALTEMCALLDDRTTATQV